MELYKLPLSSLALSEVEYYCYISDLLRERSEDTLVW